MILHVILSGSVGSRLWPLSREAHPKPVLTIDSLQHLVLKPRSSRTLSKEMADVL